MTADRAGHEPIVPGPFGIPHGTTGWKKGETYIFDCRYKGRPQWLPLAKYQAAKAAAYSRGIERERDQFRPRFLW